MARRRMNGEGSNYQRNSDGRRFGSVVATSGLGERKRKTVSSRTKEGARLKLERLMGSTSALKPRAFHQLTRQ
jgi:hypothetical protein